MNNPIRELRPFWIALGFAWLAGLALIWWLIPVGPREGWQPPANEFVSGFLNDGRTLVTIPRSASGNRIMGTTETGPIRLWDIETGELRATHCGPS